MSKAEEFIQNYTRNCSNEFEPQKAPPSVYNPWITPEDARRAVEIAREEIYKWLQNASFDNYKIADEESYRMGCPYDYIDVHELISNLKQAMKDE